MTVDPVGTKPKALNPSTALYSRKFHQNLLHSIEPNPCKPKPLNQRECPSAELCEYAPIVCLFGKGSWSLSPALQIERSGFCKKCRRCSDRSFNAWSMVSHGLLYVAPVFKLSIIPVVRESTRGRRSLLVPVPFWMRAAEGCCCRGFHDHWAAWKGRTSCLGSGFTGQGVKGSGAPNSDSACMTPDPLNPEGPMQDPRSPLSHYEPEAPTMSPKP